MKKLEAYPELLYMTFASTNHKVLDNFVKEVKEIINRLGLECKGPIPFRTKVLKCATRKSPCGRGSETYYTHVLKVHKRMLICPADPRITISLRRLKIPENIKIELKVVSQ
jgi:small subunit ribosomal protein S10